MSFEDPRFKDTVSAHFSGDDDLDDLEQNGKGLVVKERAVYIPPKVYCQRCKKGIHNITEYDERCKGGDCQCPCRTHYVGRDGRLRKYGTVDNSNLGQDKTPKPDPEFDKLQEEWRNLNKTTARTVQDKDNEWYDKHGITPPTKKERTI